MRPSPRAFKDAVYEQLARLGKAMAAPKRIELLDLLAQGPRSVEALAAQTAISVANASQHLRVLRAARLVTSQRRGPFVHYRLADDEVGGFVVALRALAERRLADVSAITRAYFEERGALEPVASEELLRRVRGGEVIVLDVRPADEYRAGHLPGAISIPVRELRSRLRELPKSREIVAYCRGPYCMMALDAVDLLRGRGYRARRLDLGVAEWRARGWRLESAPDEGSA